MLISNYDHGNVSSWITMLSVTAYINFFFVTVDSVNIVILSHPFLILNSQWERSDTDKFRGVPSGFPWAQQKKALCWECFCAEDADL